MASFSEPKMSSLCLQCDTIRLAAFRTLQSYLLLKWIRLAGRRSTSAREAIIYSLIFLNNVFDLQTRQRFDQVFLRTHAEILL